MLDTFSNMNTRIKLSSNKRARIYVSYECVCEYGMNWKWHEGEYLFRKRHRPLPLSLWLFHYVTNVLLAYRKTTKKTHTIFEIYRSAFIYSWNKIRLFGHFTAQIPFSHISVISFAFVKLLTARISQNLLEYLIKPTHFTWLTLLKCDFATTAIHRIGRFKVEKWSHK